MTEVGDVVVCQALDWRPQLLVIETHPNSVTAVLLADLAQASIQRLRHGATATVVQAVSQADEIKTYRVPTDDVAPSPAFGGVR